MRRLEPGLEGVLRRRLKLLPAEQLGEPFHAQLARPTKELHAVAGRLLLGEFRAWTVAQTAAAWSFGQ